MYALDIEPSDPTGLQGPATLQPSPELDPLPLTAASSPSLQSLLCAEPFEFQMIESASAEVSSVSTLFTLEANSVGPERHTRSKQPCTRGIECPFCGVNVHPGEACDHVVRSDDGGVVGCACCPRKWKYNQWRGSSRRLGLTTHGQREHKWQAWTLHKALRRIEELEGQLHSMGLASHPASHLKLGDDTHDTELCIICAH